VQLILASNSPRRKQLLALSGWSFIVQSADVDETCLPDEPPLKYVLRLAEAKALKVAKSSSAESIILAADTTVVDRWWVEGEMREVILGKPVDDREAEEMLRGLRGRTHQVYTGLALLRAVDGRLITDWCVTDVPMRNYTDEEMLAYIASGDPLDKAGAYAIQHPGFHPVENLPGCYTNVVGLPVCHVTRLLERMGVFPGAEAALACRSPLPHACQIDRQGFEAGFDRFP
jgi:MAF protein